MKLSYGTNDALMALFEEVFIPSYKLMGPEANQAEKVFFFEDWVGLEKTE